MEDIELIIKIPEKLLRYFNSFYLMNVNENKNVDKLVEVIRKGIPLSKGHERIIDADILRDFKNKIKHYGKDYRFTQEEILNILERYEIKYASTIIEADKEDRE